MKTPRPRVRWFRVILIVFTAVFLYASVEQQLRIHAIQQQLTESKHNLEKIELENKRLLEERELLATPKYVEKIAREELGLVKPGEVPFVSVQNK